MVRRSCIPLSHWSVSLTLSPNRTSKPVCAPLFLVLSYTLLAPLPTLRPFYLPTTIINHDHFHRLGCSRYHQNSLKTLSLLLDNTHLLISQCSHNTLLPFNHGVVNQVGWYHDTQPPNSMGANQEVKEKQVDERSSAASTSTLAANPRLGTIFRRRNR